MKNQETFFTAKKRILISLITMVLILSIPMLTMQFTNEVKWTMADFAVAAILLLSTALGIELVVRNIKTGTARTILLIVILLALFLIWAELAVGIFGTPFAGN